MNTLRRFSAGTYSIPGGTSWYLADLGEFRGKQELYTRQWPQRLKSLREHALIESAVSSNRLDTWRPWLLTGIAVFKSAGSTRWSL